MQTPATHLKAQSLSVLQNRADQSTCGHPSSSGQAAVVDEIRNQFKNCFHHTLGESQLHKAAFEGDAARLQQLLAEIDADPERMSIINQRNRLGCTPIRLAATGGHLECLNLLIDAGASIDTVDVKCQTPLFVAVKNHRLDCARRLLEAGACPEGDPGNSSTPLYVAFMNMDVRYVLLLLEYGADPDQLRHVSKVAHNTYNPKCSSLDAATEYLVGATDVYTAVKALLIRGCRSENLIYHNCVYHDRDQLVDLLYHFGLGTNGRDINNRLATELNLRNRAEQKIKFYAENPRSLLSSCRLTIFSCLPRPRINLDMLDLLPLPTSLISYLKFNDL
ncbi:ankyrin repeat and SOCS box protein 12-like isoform X2 [Physella acuta]|nr:ankyrin repeat and SOCS box protein 12-like isoform X2 [Physella acuta]